MRRSSCSGRRPPGTRYSGGPPDPSALAPARRRRSANRRRRTWRAWRPSSNGATRPSDGGAPSAASATTRLRRDVAAARGHRPALTVPPRPRCAVTPRQHTLRSYATAVGAYLDWLTAADADWRPPPRAELRAYLAELDRGARSSVSQRLAAIRSFHRLAARAELAPGDPWGAIATPRLPRRLPRVLEVDQIERLLAVIDEDCCGRDGERLARADVTALALRDRALVEAAYAAGLRISELAAAELGLLDLGRGELRVYGKGRKERIGLLGRPARSCRGAYLEDGRPVLLARRAATRLVERLRCCSSAHRGAALSVRGSVAWTCCASAPVCPTASRRIRCATFATTCSTAVPTCGSSRSCSAARASQRRRSIRTSPTRLRSAYLDAHPRARPNHPRDANRRPRSGPDRQARPPAVAAARICPRVHDGRGAAEPAARCVLHGLPAARPVSLSSRRRAQRRTRADPVEPDRHARAAPRVARGVDRCDHGPGRAADPVGRLLHRRAADRAALTRSRASSSN